MKNRLILAITASIAVVAAAFLAVNGASPAEDRSEKLVSNGTGVDTKSNAVPVTAKKNREATCANPVITFTEPVPIELKNKALIDADRALKQFEKDHDVVATPEEREAYFKQVAEVLPTEMVTETVFVDEAESPGVITDQEADPTDADFAKVKAKVKQRGCKTNGEGGVQLVSYSTVAYDNSVGWKSCSKTVSFQALNGLTVGKLRLVSEWYNNVFQVPQWIEARATGTAYYLWKTDGDEEVSLARPYYKYSSGVWYAYQNRAWQDYKYEISASIGGIGGSVTLDTHTLYAAHIVGPGGKCV